MNSASRVLLVEADPAYVRSIEGVLSSAGGFESIVRPSLAGAAEVLAAGLIDLVLLDLGLPDGSGLESLRRVRQTNPGVPVIVLTEPGDAGPRREALREGARACLSKEGAELEAVGLLIGDALAGDRIESGLARVEEKFRLLIDRVRNHAIVLLDPSGRVAAWNSGAKTILGYAPEEIVGQPFARFLPPESEDDPGRILGEARDEGRATSEGWRVRQDGSRYWSRGGLVALYGEGLRGFVLVARDSTEARNGELALRESERRFRQLADVLPQMVWTARPDGFVDSYNERWYEFTGAQKSMSGDENWVSVVHPDDLGRVGAEWYQAVRASEPFQTQCRLRDFQGGGYRWFLARGSPVRDEDGQIVSWIGTSTDIDDLKSAKESLQIHQYAIRETTQGILISDATQPDNPLIYVNQAFTRLTGYEADEVLGRNCRFLQGPDTAPETVSRLRDALARGQHCSVEILNYKKGGTTFWNALSMSPIRDESGRLIHYVGIQADVTERRKLEDQLRHSQKMEAIGQLAGGVAHDFNNLLTLINGYGDLVMKELPPGGMACRWVTEMVKAGERAASLTRQLLTFSRQRPIAFELLDLNVVFGNLRSMLSRVIGDDIELVVDLASDLGLVEVDAGQIEQVVINLVVNARDAMPRGGTITVETRNTDSDGGGAPSPPKSRPSPHVLLSISDTGQGMTEEVRARIFEPYFTTKERGKGTGLGLAIAFGVVNQAGGRIEVESKVGVGTTFRIYLPKADGVATVAPPAAHQGGLEGGDETVLLVEDDQAVRGLLALYLVQAGYEVLVAANGIEALRVVGQHGGQIHALLTDVVMPHLGGRELADRLTTLNPDLRVLFLSGFTDDVTLSRGVFHDQANFLQKPCTKEGLLRKLREILDAVS